ncbi:hypothetical protein WKV44_08025 [Spirochaetia bacterium 38H-sp]|uniref:LVIVD repeat-containing protein n=1 Tax=Rarispira pelagica TaxID=3141764 RepID=A0ABU9UCU4_9SPIR
MLCKIHYRAKGGYYEKTLLFASIAFTILLFSAYNNQATPEEQGPRLTEIVRTDSVREVDIKLYGKNAYISHNQGQLYIVDITYPDKPVLKGTGYHGAGAGSGLDVFAGYAYIANNTSGPLRIFNTSIITIPRLSGIYTSDANTIIVNGRYAYIIRG